MNFTVFEFNQQLFHVYKNMRSEGVLANITLFMILHTLPPFGGGLPMGGHNVDKKEAMMCEHEESSSPQQVDEWRTTLYCHQGLL